jgi:hypothetical protein
MSSWFKVAMKIFACSVKVGQIYMSKRDIGHVFCFLKVKKWWALLKCE